MESVSFDGMPAFSVKVSVPRSVVADLLCAAFEGGSNYWIERVSAARLAPVQSDWVHLSDVPSLGGALDIFVADPGDDHRMRGPRRLDAAACQRGLAIMAHKHAQHFADATSESSDATTGDVFLQLALFGEVIFG